MCRTGINYSSDPIHPKGVTIGSETQFISFWDITCFKGIGSELAAWKKGSCFSSMPLPRSMHSQEAHVHRHTYTPYTLHICTCLDTQIADRHTEQLYKHRQHRRLHPASLSGSPALKIYRYISVQSGSLQQLGSDTLSTEQLPLDLHIPSCWHLDIQAPRTTALV